MLQLPSQDGLGCPPGGQGHQHGEGAPLKQINTRASGYYCQAKSAGEQRPPEDTQHLAKPDTELLPEERCNDQPEQKWKDDDKNRAEQLCSRRDGLDARAEQMCNQIDERGQAENCSSSTSSSNTHSIRQSPTIPGSVAILQK